MVSDNNFFSEILVYARKVAVLCFIGLVLNILPAYIAQKFELPVWLDTVGTMYVAAIGGYLPGILIGFLTNIINCLLVDSSFIYYSLVSVIIALFASYYYSKGYFENLKSIWTLFLIIPIIAVVFDQIISFVIAGIGSDNLLKSIGTEFLDKTIVIFVVLAILRLSPKTMHDKLVIAFWQQNPLSREDASMTKNIECRKYSIRSKIIIIISGSIILVSIVATSLSSFLYHNYMISEYTQIANKIAFESSKLLDPNEIDSYVQKGKSDGEYAQILRELSLVRNATPHIEFLYVYKIIDNGCLVVFDTDQKGQPGENPGTVIPFDETFLPVLDRLKAGKEIDPIVSNDRYGWLLTVYYPVKNKDGRTVSYVGTDIRMDHIVKNEIIYLIQLMFLFVGFLILIVFSVVGYVDYSLIYPINSIALRTSEFSFNSKTAIDNNIKILKELGIHTGDEIEHLYETFLKMVENSRKYTTEIQKQKERVSKMQNSMVVVLADMVESRDENTGMHIHKTAEYVRIILEKMKELGLHKDFITDKYVNNVVNSAPLHDIGKIKIPDHILNKPGKLTDEEFAIMKTHAAAGRDMIEKVIKQVPNSSYLREAKSIAAYHHEKWDGTGYPEGLSGIKIPFSARVMAVADVFDALVSKRIYKPQMPIEKAFSIIREGAGSHFDPEIVEVFFAAQDEIQKTKEMFDRMESDQNKPDNVEEEVERNR